MMDRPSLLYEPQIILGKDVDICMRRCAVEVCGQATPGESQQCLLEYTKNVEGTCTLPVGFSTFSSTGCVPGMPVYYHGMPHE